MHNFLKIVPNHTGLKNAQTKVAEALEILGVKRPVGEQWVKGEVTFKEKDKVRKFLIKDLVAEAQKDGFSRELYAMIDRRDPFFGGTFLMATNSPAFKMKVKFGDYERELRGPCRFSPLQDDLTNDILHFRESACNSNDPNSFYDCTRNYRSFLQSSISLVDCFINRHVQLHIHRGGGQLPDALLKAGTFESRFDSWVEAFGNRDLARIKRSDEWSKFTRLRRERNLAVHAVEPYLGIQIEDLPERFNLVRGGVGGLLFQMQKQASRNSLGFIERLRNAPLIEFEKRPIDPDQTPL